MSEHNLCPVCFQPAGDSGQEQCRHCGHLKGSGAASPAHLPLGTILDNKYLVGRALGQGGFGITYLAWDRNLKLKLAIKEYFPQDLATRSAGQTEISPYTGSTGEQYLYGIDKFLQEARTLARFEGHPNIVSVRDFFKANGTAYFVMSYVEGVTLKAYLAESGGRMPFKEAKAVIMAVLDALRAVHAVGVMHRDISPDNIFIDTRGRVILLDFGAARQAISDQGRSLSIILKPGYAPEEQYRSRGEQGPWTDIYAAAATFYHLLTGNKPPEALERLLEDNLAPPPSYSTELTPGQEQALLKALAVRAGDRYQKIEDFQAALLGVKAENPFAPDMIPPPELTYHAEVNNGQHKIHSAASTSPVKPVKGYEEPVYESSRMGSAAGSTKRSLYLKITAVITAAVITLFIIILFFSQGGEGPDLDLTISPGEFELHLGDEYFQLQAEVLNIDRNGHQLEWRSGDDTVATVDSRGFVRPVSEGNTEIIAYISGTQVAASSIVTVRQVSIEVSDYPYGEGVFSGKLLDNLPHGTGTLEYADGDRYEGEFFQGVEEGEGILIYEDGGKYNGSFKAGLRHGSGKMVYSDGAEFEGEWFEDSRVKGKVTWPDGGYYEGEFSDGKRSGQGTMYFSNGNTYSGEWEDNQPHGWGTYTWPDGRKFVGILNQGMISEGTGTDAEGNKYVGSFKDGQMHGEGTYTYADGRVLSGKFENGNYVGP